MRRGDRRALWIAGAVAMALGYAWSFWLPFNKNLWTPSYVLWTAGIACWVLGLCHELVDRRGWPAWGRAFGVNAIAAYAGSAFLLYALVATGWLEPLYRHAFADWMTPRFGPYVPSLAYALAFVAAMCAVPTHMFFQLKGAYGLRTFSALWRTWFLLWFSAIALVFFLLAILYLGTCLLVILGNLVNVPAAMGEIISGAFNPEGVAGGVLGVLIIGFQRAAFSNEAGVGSILHLKERHQPFVAWSLDSGARIKGEAPVAIAPVQPVAALEADPMASAAHPASAAPSSASAPSESPAIRFPFVLFVVLACLAGVTFFWLARRKPAS